MMDAPEEITLSEYLKRRVFLMRGLPGNGNGAWLMTLTNIL